MSSNGVDQLVERIAADPNFAGEVLSHPDDALAPFELTDEERRSVADALAADLEAAGFEVQAFAVGGWDLGSVQFHNITGLSQGGNDQLVWSAHQLVWAEQ